MCKPKFPSQILSCLPSRLAVEKKILIIPPNITHTCDVGYHVDFSTNEAIMGCGPTLSSCKPKAGVHDTLTQ